MKFAGLLMGCIAAPNNLRLTFGKAADGKRAKADSHGFHDDLDDNLERLGADLLAGTVAVVDYHYFTIYDSKQHLTCVASFRERVTHYALRNVCERVLERVAILDICVCRKWKGLLAALARAHRYLFWSGRFSKLDVRCCFDSNFYDNWRVLLRRKLKDEAVPAFLVQIIDSYETTPARALLAFVRLARVFGFRRDVDKCIVGKPIGPAPRICGGSSNNNTIKCRIAKRNNSGPNIRRMSVGSRSVPPPAQSELRSVFWLTRPRSHPAVLRPAGRIYSPDWCQEQVWTFMRTHHAFRFSI